jgi:hypothetical protein
MFSTKVNSSLIIIINVFQKRYGHINIVSPKTERATNEYLVGLV